MARPKTRGDTIAVQLPLDVDGILRARAAEDGLSPGKLIADVVGRWMVATDALAAVEAVEEKVTPARAAVTRRTRGDTNIRSVPDLASGCGHKRATVVAAGLRKCVDCGAVRGVDQVWRGAGES